MLLIERSVGSGRALRSHLNLLSFSLMHCHLFDMTAMFVLIKRTNRKEIIKKKKSSNNMKKAG